MTRDPLLLITPNVRRPAILRQASLFEVLKKTNASTHDQLPNLQTDPSSGDSLEAHLDTSSDEELPRDSSEPRRKRARLSERLSSVEAEELREPESEDEESIQRESTPRKLKSHSLSSNGLITSFSLISRLSAAPSHKLGLVNSIRHRQNLSDYMQSFVSSNSDDVYRCDSSSDYRHWAPPFACSFSHAAKRGDRQLLAVATEEGDVSIINAGESSVYDRAHQRTTFDAHKNAIFDVRWSHDDRLLVSASGDQSLAVFDVETQREVARAKGHVSTIKQVVWDPHQSDGSHVLASGARDGSIRIWDLRAKMEVDDEVPTLQADLDQINLLQNAHGLRAKSSKALNQVRTATRSVTSIAYLQHRDHLLASSGSADGTIKVWDLRKSHSRRINPTPLITSPDHSIQHFGRSHGTSSITLSPDGTSLYAISTAHAVFKMDALNLASEHYQAFTAPASNTSTSSFRVESFYIKLAVSPTGHPYGSGRFLAAGSSDGSVWMWDTYNPESPAVALRGHEKEVGGLDWSSNALATCSDDMTVRLWRSDIKTRRLTEGTGAEANSARYKFSGTWPAQE